MVYLSTTMQPRTRLLLSTVLVLAVGTAARAQITDYDGFDYGATGSNPVVLHGQNSGVNWKGPWMGVPLTGLQSWWPLDFSARDAWSFGSHGTLTNATYSLTSPVVWSTHSVEMDPSRLPQIDLSAHVAKYDLLMRGTISAWVKTAAAGLDMVIIGGANKTTRNRIDLRVDNGNLRYNVTGDLPSGTMLRGSTNIANNAWHHVAVTVEANGDAILYVDGLLDAKGPQGFFGSVFNLTGLWIGRNEYFGPWGHFSGKIDDVAIWASVLTPAEIQQLASLPPGLVTGAITETGPDLGNASLASSGFPSAAFGTLGLSSVGNRISESSGLPAVRPLSRPIDFTANGTYYVSCLMRSSGPPGKGCEIQFTDSTGPHARFGWDDQGKWAAGFDSPLQATAMQQDTTYFVVCKISTALIAADQVKVRVYAPAESIHPDDGVLIGMGTGVNQWTIEQTSILSNRLSAMWILPNGAGAGTVEIDEIRLGSTWASVTRLGYGSPCLGTSIGRNGRPAPGTTLDVLLRDASPVQSAYLALGASRIFWSGLLLPFDLTAIGAPGCSVLASFDLTVPAVTDAAGMASIPLAIPNLSSLVGSSLYLQWASVDANLTNRLPLAFSDGMELLFEK